MYGRQYMREVRNVPLVNISASRCIHPDGRATVSPTRVQRRDSIAQAEQEADIRQDRLARRVHGRSAKRCEGTHDIAGLVNQLRLWALVAFVGVLLFLWSWINCIDMVLIGAM